MKRELIREVMMSTKLFVANIPDEINPDDLEKLFKKYGDVCSVSIARNQRTGKSLGWGFVEIDDRDAECAIACLNRYKWFGRRLKVSEARPRKDRERDLFGRA
jgi:RNA recognition motif-containing protein